MLFDCINYNAAQKEKEQLANQKAIKKTIAATCRDCKQNPLMVGADCPNPRLCLVVHDALVKQGLG